MITFTVTGTPIPKGSMRAFNGKTRPIVTHDNRRTKPWQTAVKQACVQAMNEHEVELFDGPVAVWCLFTISQPKSVTRKHPSTKPDLDKLQRVIGDALEGTLLTNDSRIVEWQVSKIYGLEEGVKVHVRAL